MKKPLTVFGTVTVTNTHGDRSYPGFVGNFSKLISACEAIGIKYDPANPMLSLAHLTILIATLYSTNKAVIDLLSPYKAALLSRNVAYEIMSVFKTQILNALKASENVTEAEVLIAVNLGKKVDGIRIETIKTNPETSVEETAEISVVEDEIDAIEHHSVSFQKFEIRMNNFLIFFSYVTGLACYKPKKTELKLPAIQAYYDSLPLLNSAAQLAESNLRIARQTRDTAFFNELTGAKHIATQVKNYISGDFTTKSAEYKSVKGLPFPDLRKK